MDKSVPNASASDENQESVPNTPEPEDHTWSGINPLADHQRLHIQLCERLLPTQNRYGMEDEEDEKNWHAPGLLLSSTSDYLLQDRNRQLIEDNHQLRARLAKKRVRLPKREREQKKREYDRQNEAARTIQKFWRNQTETQAISNAVNKADFRVEQVRGERLQYQAINAVEVTTIAMNDSKQDMTDLYQDFTGLMKKIEAKLALPPVCPTLYSSLNENMVITSPLNVRFTHGKIHETFMPFWKDGSLREDMTILDSATEIVTSGKVPAELEVLDVVLHEDYLHVAGTFNRRLCMYRLLAIFFPQRFSLIKVRLVDKSNIRVNWEDYWSTFCNGKFVEVGCGNYVGSSRGDLNWPEAVTILSELSLKPCASPLGGGIQSRETDVLERDETAEIVSNFAAKHHMYLPGVIETLRPLTNEQRELVLRRFRCFQQDDGMGANLRLLQKYVQSCRTNGFQSRNWADDPSKYASIDDYLQTKAQRTSDQERHVKAESKCSECTRHLLEMATECFTTSRMRCEDQP